MHELFIVFKIVTNENKKLCTEEVPVYNVRDDKNGYPHFLIYEDKQWKYVSAKHFVTYEVKAKIGE